MTIWIVPRRTQGNAAIQNLCVTIYTTVLSGNGQRIISIKKQVNCLVGKVKASNRIVAEPGIPDAKSIPLYTYQVEVTRY